MTNVLISRAAVSLQLIEHQYPDQLREFKQSRCCRMESVNMGTSFLGEVESNCKGGLGTSGS